MMECSKWTNIPTRFSHWDETFSGSTDGMSIFFRNSCSRALALQTWTQHLKTEHLFVWSLKEPDQCYTEQRVKRKGDGVNLTWCTKFYLLPMNSCLRTKDFEGMYLLLQWQHTWIEHVSSHRMTLNTVNLGVSFGTTLCTGEKCNLGSQDSGLLLLSSFDRQEECARARPSPICCGGPPRGCRRASPPCAARASAAGCGTPAGSWQWSGFLQERPKTRFNSKSEHFQNDSSCTLNAFVLNPSSRRHPATRVAESP